jgi:hypothetical protein
MVGSRESEIGTAYRSSVQAQTIEGLRTRDFVHEVQINVEERRFAFGTFDDVIVPDFFVQGSGHG